MMVTLIGEKLAKIGYEFIYWGPISECRDCRLKNVCFALDEGRRYRITKVRDVKHDCEVHEGGARVVEVEKTETPVVVESQYGIAGSTLSYQARLPCLNLGCQYYRLCFPLGFKGGERLRVSVVEREITCPEGQKLVEVKSFRSE